MKALLIALSLMIASPLSAKTPLPELLGSWFFEGPQSQEWGSPHREMSLHFDEKGLSELVMWTRQDQGVCRRVALFEYDEAQNELAETIIDLDPYNPPHCGKDPQMKVGQEIRHLVQFENDQMILINKLGERSIWTFVFP